MLFIIILPLKLFLSFPCASFVCFILVLCVLFPNALDISIFLILEHFLAGRAFCFNLLQNPKGFSRQSLMR